MLYWKIIKKLRVCQFTQTHKLQHSTQSNIFSKVLLNVNWNPAPKQTHRPTHSPHTHTLIHTYTQDFCTNKVSWFERNALLPYERPPAISRWHLQGRQFPHDVRYGSPVWEEDQPAGAREQGQDEVQVWAAGEQGRRSKGEKADCWDGFWEDEKNWEDHLATSSPYPSLLHLCRRAGVGGVKGNRQCRIIWPSKASPH